MREGETDRVQCEPRAQPDKEAVASQPAEHKDCKGRRHEKGTRLHEVHQEGTPPKGRVTPDGIHKISARALGAWFCKR